jgi:hypothetical protein
VRVLVVVTGPQVTILMLRLWRVMQGDAVRYITMWEMAVLGWCACGRDECAPEGNETQSVCGVLRTSLELVPALAPYVLRALGDMSAAVIGLPPGGVLEFWRLVDADLVAGSRLSGGVLGAEEARSV